MPWIAVPTTAGTGTEATRNAVLSVRGEDGYKKSFRHEALVARHAVVDPALLETCPKKLIAADGMDALTQLLESYVSTRPNPVATALAESGLAAVRDGLLAWYEETGDPAAARSNMAYAALVSGICLAQTGLGSVHGLASPLGAYFPIPHGVVCGTLVGVATVVNVTALRDRDPDGPALERYARAAAILTEDDDLSPDDAPEALARLLGQWTTRLRLPRLREFDVDESDLDRIVAAGRGSSMQTNPIVLTDVEMRQVLRARL
jgi:alcohol dehydrogenase